MSFADQMMEFSDALQDAAEFFRQQEMILAWPNISPGQKMVALSIQAVSFHQQKGPTIADVAALSGLSIERCERLFEGLDHAPFVLTKIGTDRERWVPSQTLEYVDAHQTGA